MRKVCVVTATRAEYGLLRPLIKALHHDPSFELQLVVTGTHLSPAFGETWQAIAEDGFSITDKVDILLSTDAPSDIAKSMSLTLSGFADVFSRLRPDLLVILGDRYEIFCVAATATVFKIPIAHLHGGETTEGAFDEAFRHGMTKMSHLHFTATEPYRQRVIQLGEDPSHVFNVGAISLDSIRTLELLSREQLANALDIDLAKPYFLVTYHPVTLSDADAMHEVDALCEALITYKDTQAIITGANADTGGQLINARFKDWQLRYPDRLHFYMSLGQLRYLSAMQHALGVVGNSSSGLVEAPAFSVGTLNIGPRQRGRLHGDSVIHAEPAKTDISEGLARITSVEFQKCLKDHRHPFGDGHTTERIMKTLACTDWSKLAMKKFHDQ